MAYNKRNDKQPDKRSRHQDNRSQEKRRVNNQQFF